MSGITLINIDKCTGTEAKREKRGGIDGGRGGGRKRERERERECFLLRSCMSTPVVTIAPDYLLNDMSRQVN